MIANSAPWDNLKYDPAGVAEVARKFFATLYNTYSFFALYANVDGFTGTEEQVALSERPEIDRWIISLLNTLISDVDAALNDYEPTRAARAINDFVIDNLSNWYVRLNRKRFWGRNMDTDKLSAYQTLHTCLLTVAKLIAPAAPFYADRLYQDLTANYQDAPKSVHLALFPEVNASAINPRLEKCMAVAQKLTSMVLSLRRKANIKVRQPLAAMLVPVLDEAQRELIEPITDLLLTEVNVKALKIVSNEEGVLVKRIKPDFKKLGPKFGKMMKAAAARLQGLTQSEIAEFERVGYIELEGADGTAVKVETSDVEIISEDIPGWLVANDGNLTVALDITITDSLRMEGIARDIINRVQNIRKTRDYDITDKIKLVFEPNSETDAAINTYSEYIAGQVLAESIEISQLGSEPTVEYLDIDGLMLKVNVVLK
jgi:isoleucyl-tRNA synthetase